MAAHTWVSPNPRDDAGRDSVADGAEVPAPYLANIRVLRDTGKPGLGGRGGADDGASGRAAALRVLVVGGSIAGCCAAIALGAAGFGADVFERTSGELRSQGAGLVVQADLAAFLEDHAVCSIVRGGG
jgi:hypothetical protein